MRRDLIEGNLREEVFYMGRGFKKGMLKCFRYIVLYVYNRGIYIVYFVYMNKCVDDS